MTQRSHSTDHVTDLYRRLLRLAEQVDRAIVGAFAAFTQHDASEAERVVAGDLVIDELRAAIEGEVLQLLVDRQQLSGSDLRSVSAILVLANELERIGDYARGIAAIVLRMRSAADLESLALINQMVHRARDMLQQAIRAVVTQDATIVEQLQQIDVIVDTLYLRVQAGLWQSMREQPQCGEQATYLLWVAHNLERIADRSVNIADRAAFIATGARTTARPITADSPSRTFNSPVKAS